MYRQKSFLAIIPARSGSKGLRDKNIKKLNGKPLIAYSIEAAKKSGIFTNIVVSTDSKKYADISIEFGADVPFLRPIELAKDESNSNDVIIHVLKELRKLGKSYDYFMLLQPTSPLRDSIDIRNAVNLLFEKDANSVVSVCESEYSPLLMNTLDETMRIDNFYSNALRRQELPTYYRLNGAIYLSKVDYFMKFKNFFGKKSYAYIMDQKKSIDIDTELDFIIAKTILDFVN